MSTRCYVGRTYVHHDGYPHGVGFRLLTCFNSKEGAERIDEINKNGYGLSSLPDEIEAGSVGDHPDEPTSDFERECSIKEGLSDVDYCYQYRGNNWYVVNVSYLPNGERRKMKQWRTVEEAMESELSDLRISDYKFPEKEEYIKHYEEQIKIIKG